MKNPLDKIVIAFGRGESPDLSGIDPIDILSFACREAYYYIHSQAPNVPEDDPTASKSRCASFVCWAIELAIFVNTGKDEV